MQGEGAEAMEMRSLKGGRVRRCWRLLRALGLARPENDGCDRLGLCAVSDRPLLGLCLVFARSLPGLWPVFAPPPQFLGASVETTLI